MVIPQLWVKWLQSFILNISWEFRASKSKNQGKFLPDESADKYCGLNITVYASNFSYNIQIWSLKSWWFISCSLEHHKHTMEGCISLQFHYFFDQLWTQSIRVSWSKIKCDDVEFKFRQLFRYTRSVLDKSFLCLQFIKNQICKFCKVEIMDCFVYNHVGLFLTEGSWLQQTDPAMGRIKTLFLPPLLLLFQLIWYME